MAFYTEHFLELRDGLIVQPRYTICHWVHALRIPLSQFRVVSHRLQVETNNQIDQSNKICQRCHLQEVDIEEHFIFRCPICYEIRERFHCLFRGTVFRYSDQRCLALYMQETLKLQAIFFSILLDQTLPSSKSLPSSWSYPLQRALSDRSISAQL
jgi:hypothetical protein